MRLLLAGGDPHSRAVLAPALNALGHEVVHTTANGPALVMAIARAEGLHAAVVGQHTLGKGWLRLLRLLRRQAPHLPVVVLLAPGTARSWRAAIMAGAFDALPESRGRGAVLEAVSRALAFPVEAPRQHLAARQAS